MDAQQWIAITLTGVDAAAKLLKLAQDLQAQGFEVKTGDELIQMAADLRKLPDLPEK